MGLLYVSATPSSGPPFHFHTQALLPHRLASTGAKIIETVHDEIILEVPEGVAGEAAVILKETMIQAGKVYVSKVPIELEVTIGKTWAEK